MIKKVFKLLFKTSGLSIILLMAAVTFTQPVFAQSNTASESQLKSLRSDVGLHGFTVNMHQLSNFTYLDNDTLNADGSSELEFVYRNVRMMSQRLGVGFQIVTGFFTDGEDAAFGIGSWGAGPVIRGYPFRTDRFQPYLQLNSLFGKDLAVSELANTRQGGEGFRVRLATRAGFALRISNSTGLFGEIGYDWESSRIFKADARVLQVNIGIDFYLFN